MDKLNQNTDGIKVNEWVLEDFDALLNPNNKKRPLGGMSPEIISEIGAPFKKQAVSPVNDKTCQDMTNANNIDQTVFEAKSPFLYNSYDKLSDVPPILISKPITVETLKTVIIENCKIVSIRNCGTDEMVAEEDFQTARGVLEVEFEGGNQFIGPVSKGIPNGFGVLTLKAPDEIRQLLPKHSVSESGIIAGDFTVEEGHLVHLQCIRPQNVRSQTSSKLEMPNSDDIDAVRLSVSGNMSNENRIGHSISRDDGSGLRCDELGRNSRISVTSIDNIISINAQYAIQYPNNTQYFGSLLNDKPHGQGELWIDDFEVSGQWTNGVFQDGRIIAPPSEMIVRMREVYSIHYRNGDFYLGEASKDIPEGKGTLYRGAKDYRGEWRLGKLLRSI